MRQINILDCTLRDGGYINNWAFKEKDTINTIENLVKSGVEIIECGFLNENEARGNNCTRFQTIEQLNKLVKDIKTSENQALVAMIESGKYNIDDLSKITPDAKIRGIRFSFRKSDLKSALKEMPKIIEKGYKLFIQPISTASFTNEELLSLINLANNLSAYAFYIVDTQGSMFKDTFKKLYENLYKNLNEDIKIGFHSHNNMQLSYAIAIEFIEMSQNRNIIIDSSIYGMGRGAGNLNTELLSDYINKKQGKSYKIDYILELIDTYYYSIYKSQEWGYSLAHFLSASLECHPNYASYLLDTKHLSINEIKHLLSEIPKDESFEYNKKIIQTIYFKYNSKKIKKIKELHFINDKKILLLGSGKNLKEKIETIKKEKEDYIIISLNHVSEEIKADYYFFNIQKRYNEFQHLIEKDKLIITNNLEIDARYVLDYEDLSLLNEKTYNDNSAIMMINYLNKKSSSKVYLAGVDGFNESFDNYNYEETDKIMNENAIKKLNKSISKAIKILSERIQIIFLTTSLFENKAKLKIIGVIPARYASTRLPTKPLKEIEGLPMVVHVMKRAKMCKLLDEVIVATDDMKVFNKVNDFGGKAIMTSPEHENGTLRMHEVSTKIEGDIFVLLNGDEPLIEPIFIEESINGLLSSQKAVASLLVTPYSERNNPSNFKVALNNLNEVMYISRNDIPSDARSDNKDMWKAFHIVSYKKDFLDIYANELNQTELDLREMDDQLRILEYGYTIQAVKTKSDAISVDTKEDLDRVREIMKKDTLFSLYKD